MARSRKWKNKPDAVKAKSRMQKIDRQIAAANNRPEPYIDTGDFTLVAQARAMRRIETWLGGPISRAGGLR